MADAKRKASRRQPEASSPEPTASGAEGALDRLFGLTAVGSGVGTELRAGLATGNRQQAALGLVFLSGVLFFPLSLSPLRGGPG